MEDQFNGLLTATVFLPLAGALAIVLLLRGDGRIRIFAVAVAMADLALGIVVFALFEHGEGDAAFQMVDRIAWIGQDTFFNNSTFTANYHLAVDGISAPLILLTGLLGPVP